MIDIIFLGDIVGRYAREAVRAYLKDFKNDNTLIIANVENAAGGFGLTKKVYKELSDAGVDIQTGGNHIWDKDGVYGNRDLFKYLTIPVNLPKSPPFEELNSISPAVHMTFQGMEISLLNIAGRVFMQEDTKDPFKAFDYFYEKECKNSFVIVDFHAEATSEKAAFAIYAKNRAHAVIGTHTHVQTNDPQMIENTFFISDAGSCSAVNSILGMEIEGSMSRFLGKPRSKMKVEASGPIKINGIKMTVDKNKKKIVSFEIINKIY